ncbi:MAG TPA: S8 family serine peptidase [Pseudoxanthomonas sp.]
MSAAGLGRAVRLLFALFLLTPAGTAVAEKMTDQTLQVAQQQGKARVLVMLRDEAIGLPGTRRQAANKRRVAGRIDNALAHLPRKGYLLRRRLTLVPAMALEADAATLRRLRNDPAVVRIDLDLPVSGNAMAPDQSSVLTQVSALLGSGIDGDGLKVAVIDSGVDIDHPDLGDRLIDQQCFCSRISGSGGCCPNGQSTQSGPGAAEDDQGHGSNVSGIIVGEGIVAPRGALPAAQLIAVKVLDSDNDSCCSSDVLAAMDWLAANHPDIVAVNLSLGTDVMYEGDCDSADAATRVSSALVAEFVARGTTVVASSGNTGSSSMMQLPACLRDVVSVGATWDFDGGSISFLGCTESGTAPLKPTCFTNRSTTTDLYAAGAFVRSMGRSGGTSSFGGTSQAAPMVTSCMVGLKQAVPESTIEQRIEVMKLSPTRVTDPVSGRTYPFLNCLDALDLLTPVEPPKPIRVNGAQPRIPPVALPMASPPVRVPVARPTIGSPAQKPARDKER